MLNLEELKDLKIRDDNSNTTLVNVKFLNTRNILYNFLIQIQHLLMLNFGDTESAKQAIKFKYNTC